MSTVRGPVLVTGAGGFIGRRMVQRALDDGVEVAGLFLAGEPVPADLAERIEVRRGDVRVPAEVDVAVSGVGTVIHLAALVAEAADDYGAHWDVTARGSENVYRAAARHGARVVVTTSICAYGAGVRTQICDEEAERGPHQGPYSRAKQGQEDAAHAVAASEGLAVTIVRPANVYGIGSRPWLEIFAAGVQMGLPMLRPDTNNAGLVHVDNLADALWLLAGSAEAIGQTYNVCDGLDVTWRQYADDFARILGVAAPASVDPEPVFEAARANEDLEALVGPKDPSILPLEFLNLIGSDNRFPTDRLRALGWKPRVGYAEAMAEIEAHLGKSAS